MEAYLISIIGIAASVVALAASLFAVWRVTATMKRQTATMGDLLDRSHSQRKFLEEWMQKNRYDPIKSRELQELQSFLALPEAMRIELSSGKVGVAQVKKAVITKLGLKTFYHLDAAQVQDLYPQISKVLAPIRIEIQETADTLRKGEIDTKIVKGTHGKKESTETKRVYETADLTPEMMYNEVENYLFTCGEVAFGIEDFEYDESPISEFHSMCEQMESKFNFPLPDNLQKRYVSHKMRSYALDRVKAISCTGGYVAVQGEFRVTSAIEPSCNLELEHPLNTHLSNTDPRIRIALVYSKSCLKPLGLLTFTEGKSITITCVGKVIRWDKERGALEINPIAIY